MGLVFVCIFNKIRFDRNNNGNDNKKPNQITGYKAGGTPSVSLHFIVIVEKLASMATMALKT